MEIVVSQEQGRVPITVFHVKGEINTDTYDQFQAAADQAREAGTRNLLVDLSEVSYVSSYGVRALSYVFKLMRSDPPAASSAASGRGAQAEPYRSPHFKLLNPTRMVLEVLRTAGLDMFVEIHHDRKTAVASFE